MHQPAPSRAVDGPTDVLLETTSAKDDQDLGSTARSTQQEILLGASRAKYLYGGQ